ncbi:MAG: hypothetical protein AAGG99_05065, partial [Pseudomonadota bacterium]
SVATLSRPARTSLVWPGLLPLSLAAFAVAAMAGVIITATPMPAGAAACLSTHTHWGRMAWYKPIAQKFARDGMAWKVETRLTHAKRVVSGISIRQCKWRGAVSQWQCQAVVTVNNCA